MAEGYHENPPTYEDSVRTDPIAPSSDNPATLSHNRTITSNDKRSTLTAFITSLLDGYIIPNLPFPPSLPFTNTLILIPTNHPTLSPATASPTKTPAAFPGERVVSLPSSANATIIRLQESDFSIESLRQNTVLQELNHQLSTHLQHLGYFIKPIIPPAPTATKPNPDISIHSPSAEWNTPSKAVLAKGEVALDINLQNICLRIQNHMALFETRSGIALVIGVEIGG
ncbi:MAG: hypothetical protein Q9164_001067 [Protoblastenia rupestris]